MASTKFFVVRVDEGDDPNETVMSVIDILPNNTMSMHPYTGFAAHDIMKLLEGKINKNEQDHENN